MLMHSYIYWGWRGGGGITHYNNTLDFAMNKAKLQV